MGVHYTILSKCAQFEIFHNKNVIIVYIRENQLSG